MDGNYAYPINLSWSTEELTSVLYFLNQIEKAYEGGADAEGLIKAYADFKKVVPSKGEEKQIGRDFEAVSSYSVYRAVQAAKVQEKGMIRLGN